MLTGWQDLAGAFSAAMDGAASPWFIGLALALTTLLVEDLALAAGAALAAHGTISWELAFVGVAGGIAVGDLGLYGVGVLARRVPWLRRKYITGRGDWARMQLLHRLPTAVLLARVIPGLRLVTYTACGFLRVPLAPFCAWVAIAVTLWTASLFWLSDALGGVISSSLGIPVPVAVALPIIVVAVSIPLFRFANARLRRRTA